MQIPSAVSNASTHLLQGKGPQEWGEEVYLGETHQENEAWLRPCASKRVKVKWKLLSRVWLFVAPWTIQSLEFSSNQGSNTGLLHCRWILYQLSHQGSPRILEWVAYPFPRGSSQARNQTGVSCVAGGFFTNWAIREAPSKRVTLLSLLSKIIKSVFLFRLGISPNKPAETEPPANHWGSETQRQLWGLWDGDSTLGFKGLQNLFEDNEGAPQFCFSFFNHDLSLFVLCFLLCGAVRMNIGRESKSSMNRNWNLTGDWLWKWRRVPSDSQILASSLSTSRHIREYRQNEYPRMLCCSHVSV